MSIANTPLTTGRQDGQTSKQGSNAKHGMPLSPNAGAALTDTSQRPIAQGSDTSRQSDRAPATGPQVQQPRPTGKGPQTDADRALAITALLQGGPAPGGPDVSGAADDEGEQGSAGGADAPKPDEQAKPKPKPKTVQEAAEHLGMTPDELYGLEIGLGGDAEPVSLGKLKDAWKDRDALDVETADRRAALIDAEVQSASRRRLWEQLGAEVARVVPPKLMQQLQAQERRNLVAEEERFFQANPDLRDATKLHQFRQDVVEILGRVAGYEPQEIAIYDHRQFKVIQHVRNLEQALKIYRDIEARHSAPKGAAVQGRGAKAATVGKPKDSAGQVSAITSLLSGGKKRNG